MWLKCQKNKTRASASQMLGKKLFYLSFYQAKFFHQNDKTNQSNCCYDFGKCLQVCWRESLRSFLRKVVVEWLSWVEKKDKWKVPGSAPRPGQSFVRNYFDRLWLESNHSFSSLNANTAACHWLSVKFNIASPWTKPSHFPFCISYHSSACELKVTFTELPVRGSSGLMATIGNG